MTDTISMVEAITEAYQASSKSIAVRVTGGEAVLGKVAQQTTVVSANLTRPAADTTTYAIADVMSDSLTAPTVLTFANVARVVGGSGYITKVRAAMNSPITTNAVFRLWLYSVAPAATNDNSPMALLWASVAKRVGYIDISMTTEGTGSDAAECTVSNIRLPFSTAVADKNLYGVMEVRAAYVPVGGELFTLELSADCN